MADWLEQRKRVKVINMEHRGQDIDVGCQGIRFLIKDQAVVSLPLLVIENLQAAVIEKWKITGQMGAQKSRMLYLEPRFQVIELADTALTDDEKKRIDLIGEARSEMSDDFGTDKAQKVKGKK